MSALTPVLSRRARESHSRARTPAVGGFGGVRRPAPDSGGKRGGASGKWVPRREPGNQREKPHAEREGYYRMGTSRGA
jgi:hypothetical protein